MPRVSITSASGIRTTVELERGARLLDACDESAAPVEFSCRNASCGVCRVEVVAGSDLVEPPSVDEREVLARIGAATEERLACQLIAVVEEGQLVLRSRSP